MDKRTDPALPSLGDDKAIDPKPIPADPAIGSSVVFCGGPAEVSAGFAMALKLMGMGTPVPDISERDPPEKDNDP